MPTIRNWQDWDDASDEVARRGQYPKGYSEDDTPARPKQRKSARFEPEERREKTKKRRDRADVPYQDFSATAETEPVAQSAPPRLIPPPAAAPTVTSREGVGELSGLQVARAYARGGTRQIYQFVKQGLPITRIAGALGMPPEMVEELYRREQAIVRATAPAGKAVRLFEGGSDFSTIAAALRVSEAEARQLYARGHVERYGTNPAKQYGRREGQVFPPDVFSQPTYISDANRNSTAIAGVVQGLRKQLEPHGYGLETSFEADAMGGRHTVRVVDEKGGVVGQPFRVTATPGGVPLISKTGRAPGGYRLTFQGQGSQPLDQRLSQASLQMAANDKAKKSREAARKGTPLDDDYAEGNSLYDEQGWGDDAISASAPPPPPMWDDDILPGVPTAQATALTGKELNVLDILDVNAKRDSRTKGNWKQISGSDFMRLSNAGRFREENAEDLALDQFGQKIYPPGLVEGGYLPAGSGSTKPLTPMVSKGSVYPLQSRNFIPGNIELESGAQWGSQKSMGKQVKRDELSLTRKYWLAGPALGVAYPQSQQHILGQRADEPETAYTARAFVLDRGGIIPEGQMWKDTGFAPWVFGSFEQAPEKYELRFDSNYSEQEVLKAAGLLGSDGQFRPRILRPGDKVSSPIGFSKDVLANNEAGVINDYEIVDTLDEQGKATKALRLKGFFGNRPNVVSAMKLEGWKNLAQEKNVRKGMGINADIITNKPSDPVVANIGMLNAMPRNEFEALWTEVHGDRPSPTRTSSMSDVEALAPVWQRLQEKNRATEIIPNQVVDADTLKNYLDAGIVKDGKYSEVPPLFAGAEKQYRLDLIASGYYAPVRTNFVTDVTNLRSGHLSNEILTSIEHNVPGLGENLRELGYKGRDIYNTLFEMHQLNTKPGFSEGGTPVVDLIGDISGDPAVLKEMQGLYAQKLAGLLPESMQGLDPADYTPEQQAIYKKFQGDSGAQAIRQYYEDSLGTDSFIFRLGQSGTASHLVNPGLVERFGFIDEMTNERLSKLRTEGDFQLREVWKAADSGNIGAISGLQKNLPRRMKPVIQGQEEILQSPATRKKWFGTSDSSITTHVHASDYGLPRNAMAMNWPDILKLTGLKGSKANRSYLSKLSRAGQLPFSGLRNPASDPIAQTATILNMITPDILKEAGLDIPLAGHPVLFHPHQVQAQGGDNDSDMSQVYLVMKKMAGELSNTFGLSPTDPELITARARRHAAGEYTDAISKMNVLGAKELAGLSPEEQQQAIQRQVSTNLLGFDPSSPVVKLAGKEYTTSEWTGQTLNDYVENAKQIGQAYNNPIRIGIPMTKNPVAKERVSEYGGWMYQNPLDKMNYAPGSPEADLFNFFTSRDAFTGTWMPSKRQESGAGTYFSYRKGAGFQNRGQFGAAGLLGIMQRLTEKREGVQAQMTKEQMAAFITSSQGDMSKMRGFIDNPGLPTWEELDSKSISRNKLKLDSDQQNKLERFATGDSPLAQMMRGFGVRTGLKGAATMQRKLLEDMPDPARRELVNTRKFQSDLRERVNVLQNEMFNRGGGSGSDEFKADYTAMMSEYPGVTNWFDTLDPGSKGQNTGEFYASWPAEKQQGFYKRIGDMFAKHVTGYGRDEAGRWRNLDESVFRTNPLFRGGIKDYDRIRGLMAVNAREHGEDEIEGYSPSLDELGESEVTGSLVREKFKRKSRRMSGLSRLLEQFTEGGGQGGIGPEFEAFVAGRKLETREETEMYRQAQLGRQEAAGLRAERRRREGYEEPMYFAEGGVLTRPTQLGETGDGQAVVGGEAGKEFVVPERKTQDLGGGLKLFDTEELGDSAPQGSKEVALAKGGIIDYQAYAGAPTQDYKTAILQVAQELSGGVFAGDLSAAEALVRQKIEADIGQLMAAPPVGGKPGLYASSIPGRATDVMAQALGPDPAAVDFSAWNSLLADYGLSADVQPLGVNPQQMDPGLKKQLYQQAGGDQAAYKTALTATMQQLNSQLAGKGFSHANYGNVYDAVLRPQGGQAAWPGGRPASTLPGAPPSAAAQANLGRLMGGQGSGPNGPNRGGGQPPGTAAPGTPTPGTQPQAPVVAFTKPFTENLVAQLQQVVKGISDPSMKLDMLQAAGSGAMMADLEPEQRSFAEAASAIQTSYQKELGRAQRTIEKFENQEESRDVRRALKASAAGKFSLGPDEEQTLSDRQEQLKAHRAGLAEIGMTQKIPETEYLLAQQVKDLLTAGMGGVVGTQDLTPTGEDAQKILAAQGFKGSYMSSEGARYVLDPETSRAVQAGAQIMAQTKAAKPELEARRTAEQQDLRLSQLAQRRTDQESWYQAIAEGEGKIFSDPASKQDKIEADDLSALSRERQAAYEKAVPYKRDFHAAQQSGDIKAQQQAYDVLAPLGDQIDGLRDQIGVLTPHVKENVDQLREQTSTIRDQIKENKAFYSSLTEQENTLRSQALGLAPDAKAAKLREADVVGQDRAVLRDQIKSQAKVLGRVELERTQLSDLLHEPQGRAITGLGQRPQTRGEMAMGELAKGYSPQKLFWEFQNIQQMQFMAFQPMLKMQQQYLGEQAAMGQANYALGGGGMPQSVLSALGSQASMSRASSAFGQGVDNSLAMNAWRGLTGFLGQNEGAGSFLGAAGFDLTSGLTAAMGAKMVGGPVLGALSKLTGIGQNGMPVQFTAPGGMTGASVLAAAGGGGGLLAGGLGLGLGMAGYEMVRPEDSATLSQHATVGTYEAGGFLGGILKSIIPGPEGYPKGPPTFWDQETAERWGGRVGKYTGAVTEPDPPWVKKIQEAAAAALGVSEKELPFDTTELAQVVQMLAETQGFTKKQIEEDKSVAEQIGKDIAESVISGVSSTQQSSIHQKAVDVSGYAPGTPGAKMMSEWVNQGSLFERQQRLEAAAIAQGTADQMDYNPQQRRDLSQRTFDQLASGVSRSQLARGEQQRTMSNQFAWSEAAYASGNPEMAMQDQARPWMPKYQQEMWDIEDRRRGEDNARELGQMTLGAGGFSMQGGRQEIELGWQRQKLDLEQEFWDFRKQSQLDDFAMQQKFFDFNIRQQRLAMEFEEKQSKSQATNYEKQYALSLKIFNLQSGWQRQDFNKQDARQDIQRGWQMEDSAWNRESFNIQSGWQAEDLQRSLRYASSGRERMDIRRQIERQSIMADRQQTEFDRGDARNATQYSWAKEDLNEARSRFEELNELQRQQMELGHEYWLQQQSMASEYRTSRKAAMEESIALQTEQNNLTIQQFNDGLALTDQQHALDTIINETKHQWALDDLELARQRAAEDEKILGWNRETANASFLYAFYQTVGYDKAVEAEPKIAGMATAAGLLADNMERYQAALGETQNIWSTMPTPGSPAGPQLPTPQMPTPSNPAGPAAPVSTPNPNGIPDAPMTPAPLPPWLNNFAGGGPAESSSLDQRGAGSTSGGSAEVVALLAAILVQLQDGGGVIMIDEERLKQAGFLHADSFDRIYR